MSNIKQKATTPQAHTAWQAAIAAPIAAWLESWLDDYQWIADALPDSLDVETTVLGVVFAVTAFGLSALKNSPTFRRIFTYRGEKKAEAAEKEANLETLLADIKGVLEKSTRTDADVYAKAYGFDTEGTDGGEGMYD